MTSRERVLQAVSHKTSDLMPSTLYLDDSVRETLAQSSERGRKCLAYPDDTVRILWDNVGVELDDQTYLDPFGVRYHRSISFDQWVDPPMQEPDARLIPRIQLLPEDEEERVLSTRRENPDKFIYYQFSMTFGERLWALRGFERYLMDLVEYPNFIHEALDVLMEMHCEALERLFKLPIDGVTFGDDFGSQRGMMISPNNVRTFYKKRLGDLFGKVRDKGLVAGFHSCGDNTEIMRDYLDIGLQIFHPLQPECMDIAQIKREFGKDLTFRGGIGMQTVVVQGTPEEIARYVLDSARILSENGGYILEPCKPLPPETPLENAIAFIEAMYRARRYEFQA